MRAGSGGAGDDDVAEGFEGVAGGAGGQRVEHGAGVVGPAAQVGAGGVHGRVGAQQRQRLGVARVVVEVGVEQLEQPAVAGPARLAERRTCSTGRVGTPSRRSVPAVLPDSVASEATSSRSSESWNATPIRSPKRVITSTVVVVGAGEQRTEPPRRRDQRAGLVGDHRRGSARPGPRRRLGPTVSRIWPVTSRSNVRACSRTHSGPRSARMSDARANRKSPVRIATVLPHRALALCRAAAQQRLVHHVVVVERREMGQLDDDGRRHDAGRVRVAELRASSTSSGRKRLPPASTRWPRRLGDERVVALHGVAQLLLDRGHARGAGRRRAPGRTWRARTGRWSRRGPPFLGPAGSAGQRTNCDELAGEVEDLGGPDAEHHGDHHADARWPGW